MVWLASVVLASVAGLVLLIACSNAANLLLARGAARQQEMAVRLALGATRKRIVRQLLTESLCFGAIGGGAGLLAAYTSMQLVARTLPSTSAFVTSRLDGSVLLFTVLVSVAAGLVFGTLPALGASKGGVAEALKGARTVGRGVRRVTAVNMLLVGQVALSFLLLITAALFVRSIQRAYEIDPGFDAARLAVFITTPGQAGYSGTQARLFYQRARERVQGLAGVESASWASNMPLFARPLSGLRVEGRSRLTPSDTATTIVNTVDTGYFAAIGVPIVNGREFSSVDVPSSRPVAIVNEKLVRDFWPDDNPLGRRIQIPGELHMREIVGVARNANYSTWGEPPQRCVYVPLEQNPLPAMTLYVRSAVPPEQVVNTVRGEIDAAGPNVLVTGVRTGRQVIDGSLFQARIGVALLGAFGILALILASIGLYGILAYAVRRRHREIGLRMALGASKGSVLRQIVKEGMSLVVTGMLIGLAAALMAGRVLRAMLYNVAPTDPVSLVAATGVLCGVALLACYLPARRATTVDPLDALRQ
jgi:predicted permease